MRILKHEPGVSGHAIWETIQGEGFLAGTPTVFVRLQRCSIGCAWCDTAYDDPADEMLPMEVAEEVCSFNSLHVCLTGGEPLQTKWDELELLCRLLHERNRYVTVETAGVFIPAVSLSEAVDFWSVSPKMPSAKVKHKHHPMQLRDWFINLIQLGKPFQVKIVIADEADYAEAMKFYRDLGAPVVTRCNLVFQPESSTSREFYRSLLTWVHRDFSLHNLRVLPQVHKMLAVP